MNGKQAPRLGVIDVGTNSIRLLVAEVGGAAGYRVLHGARVMTRLGEGLHQTGRLGGAAVERSLVVLEEMKETSDGYGLDALRVVATSAMRDAVNADEFVRAAQDRCGIHVEVISGEQEADLALLSVRSRFTLPDHPVSVVDIGGGSLEVIVAVGGAVDRLHSLPLGAVRLTERFLRADPVAEEEWKALCRGIDNEIRGGLGETVPSTLTMIGSGGTFTALARMVVARSGGAGSVQGLELSRDEIEGLMDQLRSSTLEQRKRIAGLDPDRADIIVGGAAVVARLAKHLGAERILVNDFGIRDGLLLSMIAERGCARDQA